MADVGFVAQLYVVCDPLFSLPQLSRSWFAPYKRITESRGGHLDFESIASYVIINLLSRIVGGLVRTVLIAIGLLALVFVIGAGFVIYAFWMVAPLTIIGLLGMGLSLLLI